MITDQDIVNSRKVQLRLLDAVKTICDKHQLEYWLDFGTLLGAVRHKGFIPWDDDIDISMPIEDYKKFLKIAEEELPRDIFLQTPKTDPAYKQCMAKLRDCYSTFLEHRETGKEPYHHGIYMDIFPSVYYPKMPRLLRKVLLYVIVRARERAVVVRKNVFLNYTAYLVAKSILMLFWPFKSDEFGMIPEDNGYYFSVPRKYLYPITEIEFEGKLYPGPYDPDGFLTSVYNKNYMTPPPPEQRIPHANVILIDTPCNHPRALHKKHA